MSASINGSDVQTLLNATHGLGFVEGTMLMLFIPSTVYFAYMQ